MENCGQDVECFCFSVLVFDNALVESTVVHDELVGLQESQVLVVLAKPMLCYHASVSGS